MERKGLSQILYLIIAASVLMMIAMVITFTATDTIGGLGGSASKTQCVNSIQGKCTAQQTNYVQLPPGQCTTNSQYVEGINGGDVVPSDDGGPDTSGVGNVPASDVADGTDAPYYAECANFQ
jgi:hypothetical protein